MVRSVTALLGAVLALAVGAPALADVKPAPAAPEACANPARPGPDGRPRCADTQATTAKPAPARAEQDRKDCAVETKKVLGKDVTHRVCP